MIDFFQSILAFIFALGILITFHEFGHYWVAKRCNVKILRFSVGFGKPIWRFDFKQPFWHLGFTHNPWKLQSLTKLLRQREFEQDETEFVLAALPLGGYVKMLDEREGTVKEEELKFAFNRKSLGQRLAIVLAGPIFNFIFAILAYWLIYMIGISGLKPVIDEVEQGSIAMEAGFVAGQEIIAVDGAQSRTWSTVIERIVPNVVDGKRITVEVVNDTGSSNFIELDLSRISIDEMANGMLLTQLGITPWVPEYPAVLGEISPGGAADQAGLLPGDRITMANGIPMESWSDWVEIIRANPGEILEIELVREGLTMQARVTPAHFTLESGEVIGRIGAAFDTNFIPDENYYVRENYSVLPAVYKAMGRTIEMSIMTLQILGKMILGEASVKNLSGPITIAKYAGDTANLGIVAFLGFLAIVSVSLGVLNLLPVPLLDGGHVLFYLIEGIKGSPLSEPVQVMGQQIGLILLLCLMVLALYNDILRVIS